MIQWLESQDETVCIILSTLNAFPFKTTYHSCAAGAVRQWGEGRCGGAVFPLGPKWKVLKLNCKEARSGDLRLT